jgi:acyl transferase domain-containing protein/acyl carrier protein
VDTACSSSLVAIHLACESIRSGASEAALAGGVNVILRPETTLGYSDAKMLSPDGHCKFGDAGANGYVRGEGAGIVLLKPLHRALADGDPIHALIRGGAINNDGRSSGLLIAPSREGQREMLRAALRDAQVGPEEVEYIEAHGTGTLVGDPVEIDAISSVLGGQRETPCLLGSIKTNFGHTEAAAGVAGLIKTALSLKRRTIPASLHFHQPNPRIPWGEIPVKIQSKTIPWPTSTPQPCAGVSGFGITGTNAHIVLQAPPARPAKREDSTACAPLFLLSAQSGPALEARAGSWLSRLRTEPAWPPSLSDLAYTAAMRQTHHDFRLAFLAHTREELSQQLEAFLAKEEERPYLRSGRRMTTERRKTAFVYAGQGGQWPGMAQGLFRDEPVFREALLNCDRALQPLVGWSLVDRLNSDEEDALRDIDVVQPALFSYMVGLTALWRSFGVEPDAVVGHSMGEVAAAFACGALSLEDAAAVVAHRSRLMKTLKGNGAMAVTQMGVEACERLIRAYHGRVSIAAINGPTSTVLSGDVKAIEQIVAKLEERQVFCRRIKVDVASHSAHMEPLQTGLASALRGIHPQRASVPFCSTTTGKTEEGTSLGPEYWVQNLRQTVLFAPAVQALLRDGFDTFIEMSPHPVLSAAIEEGAASAESECVAIPTSHRDSDERLEMLNAMAALHVSGFPLDLGRLYPQGTCIELPTYPWQRKRRWIEAKDAVRRVERSQDASTEKGNTEAICELKWEPLPLPLDGERARKEWILFDDGAGLADRLAALLRSRGDGCICVADTARLGDAIRSLGESCSGVICFPHENGADGRAAIKEAWRIAQIVRGLSTDAGGLRVPLWLVTSGAQQLPGDGTDVAAAQAVAWGMSGVIGAEFPAWSCSNVDCSFFPSSEELQAFVVLLHSDRVENRVAIRGGACFAARFARSAAKELTQAPRFRDAATYLITGGMGGVGLELAKWIVQSGGRHIALLGRREPSEEVKKEIARLELQGATIRVLRADIADERQIKASLKTIAEEMPGLRGIFHLAAIMEGALLASMREEQLERVMLPKVAGAWALHRYTEDLPLDFFVFFSSITASLSQPGLSSYAAANAFLDALARYRKAKGLRALSLEWSPWLNVGLVNDQRVQVGMKEYAQQGIRGLHPEAALEVLQRALRQEEVVSYVFPADWEQFGRAFADGPMPRAFLNLVPGRAGEGREAAGGDSLRDRLLAAAPGRMRRSLLETHVQEILAKILKTDVAQIDSQKALGGMGVDSLMAVQVVRMLARTTSVQLPATSVFNYPTVRALSAELANRMGVSLQADGGLETRAAKSEVPATEKNTPAAKNTPASFAATVADLTEEEALRSLTNPGGAS